eukprot:scaffold14619_cov146-Amphora_coffeaeformis.AAC.6
MTFIVARIIILARQERVSVVSSRPKTNTCRSILPLMRLSNRNFFSVSSALRPVSVDFTTWF